MEKHSFVKSMENIAIDTVNRFLSQARDYKLIFDGIDNLGTIGHNQFKPA